MNLRLILGLILLAALPRFLPAVEKGDLVVVRQDVEVHLNNEKVDQVGPGQVLRVLHVRAERLWVSRGRPGWIDKKDVIELDQAELHFSKPFARGATSRDHLARGTVRMALGKHAEGIADLEKAVELAGQPGEYLEPLGYAQLAARDQTAAIETFNRAIGDEPDSAAALMGRGLAYYQVGRHQNAIDDLTKAITLERNHAFPRKYLGALFHDVGRLEDAKRQLDFAVKLDAHDNFARKARGRLLFDQGDYELRFATLPSL